MAKTRKKTDLKKLLKEMESGNATLGYVPTHTQKMFRDSHARYKLLTGPNRGGKTGHIAWEVSACAQRVHPSRSVKSQNGVYLVLAPSLEQISDPWEKKLLKQSELAGKFNNKPMIPDCEIKKVYKSQSSSGPVARKISMKNGHDVLLMPSGDPNIWKRIQGKNLLGVVLDENIGDLDLIRELILRLLDTNSNDAIVAESGGGWLYWGATDTEFNEGFSWFLEKCEDDREVDFSAFWIDPSENPAIKQEEREKLRSILGSEQASIRLDGTGTSLGLITIYGEQWDDKRHITKEPIEILPEDNLWVSYDPGVSHPTGIICTSINPKLPQQIRIHRFYNHKRKTVEFDLECIADWLQGRWLEGFILDPASKRTEKSGNSVFSQIRDSLKEFNIKVRRGIQIGYNRHEAGITQTRRALTDGNVLVDNNGDGCPLFCYQMRKYRGRPETHFTGPQGVIKKDDEAPDVIRYLISKFPAWVERPPNFLGYSKPNPTVKEMVAKPSLVPDTISEDDSHHLDRLRVSAQMMKQHRPSNKHGFGSGSLPF